MKKVLITMLVASVFNTGVMLYSKDLKKKQNKVIMETGLVLIDGVPKYFDPNEMNSSMTFVLSKKAIKKSKGSIIKSAVIDFSVINDNEFIISIANVDKNDSYIEVDRSNLFYKIENNNMYVSKDKIDWDRLYLKLIDDKPKDPDYWIVVYFKCKYFEGEYVMERHPGD